MLRESDRRDVSTNVTVLQIAIWLSLVNNQVVLRQLAGEERRLV